MEMIFDNSKNEGEINYQRRREIVFVLLSGIFLGSLAMLNILGLTRQLDLSFTIGNFNFPFIIFLGVLPYPITFLCTDFISELYGRNRANMVVWIGLFLNFWVVFIIWLGSVLPPHPEIIAETGLPAVNDPNFLFFSLKKLTFGAVSASMIAYLTAQFVDVQVFHFLKKLTKGKMLWLRNNGSTFTSQMVDSVAVILVTYFYTHSIIIPEDQTTFQHLKILILGNYFFKMGAALLDTIPFYLGTKMLSKFLNIDPLAEISQEKEDKKKIK